MPATADPGNEPGTPDGAAAPQRTPVAVPQADVDLARALGNYLRIRFAALVPNGRPARRLVPPIADTAEDSPCSDQPVDPDLRAAVTARLADSAAPGRIGEVPTRPGVRLLDVDTAGGRRVAVVVAERAPDDPWDAPAEQLAAFLVDFFARPLTAFAQRPRPTLATRPESDRERRRSHDAAIRTAAEQGELTLLFQPEVDMPTGTVLGAEALVRWDHPQLGRLGPDAFIADAERTDLIDVIDLWVLAESLRAAAGWPDTTPLVVGVNVSPALVGSPGFVGTVDRLLAEHALPAAQLRIEITERLELPDDDSVETAVEALVARGVRIAIDDVGTGYSSLSRLRRLRADVLKIDRSLVTGIDDDRRAQVLVAGLATIAAGLQADVVAEGIERQAEADTLRELGVRRAQGHLFGRPMSGEQLRQLVTAGLPA